MIALRPLYGRDHLDHVLGTFGLILFFNELVRIVWGPAGRTLRLPAFLETSFEILPGVQYPTYRIAIIVTALAVALFLYILVMRTRLGMLIRAGAGALLDADLPPDDGRAGTAAGGPVPGIEQMSALLTPRNLVVAALLIFLALVPVYASVSGNVFLMTLFTRIIILAIAATSLNLILGYGGMVSFGHAV